MPRDLNTVSTEALQAEYDAGVEQIRDLRERLDPLNAELTKRCNARAFVLNAVMAGQGAALVAAGVPAADVEAAGKFVAAERARKLAAREGVEVSS